jgi:YHS domain-containing protein
MKTNIFLLTLSVLVVGLITTSCNNQVKQTKKANVQIKKSIVKSQKSAQLKSSFVCYVNDRFMGSEQIPVAVNNKTYYGCCGGCVEKLKKNLGNVRFAKDPLTGSKVDKATAFIVLKPHANGAVLYFESEENYKKYTR